MNKFEYLSIWRDEREFHKQANDVTPNITDNKINIFEPSTKLHPRIYTYLAKKIT